MKCLCCRKNAATDSAHSNLGSRTSASEKRKHGHDCYLCSSPGHCEKLDSVSGLKTPQLWYPSQHSIKSTDYIRRLECEYACMQKSILTLTTHFARMQFRLRQILQASPCERYQLLKELETLAFEGLHESDFGDEMPHMQRDLLAMGCIKYKQNCVIKKLRGQLATLQEATEIGGLSYVDAGCPPGMGGMRNHTRISVPSGGGGRASAHNGGGSVRSSAHNGGGSGRSSAHNGGSSGRSSTHNGGGSGRSNALSNGSSGRSSAHSSATSQRQQRAAHQSHRAK